MLTFDNMLSNWLAESVSKLSCLKDFSLPAVASSHEVEGMMETKIPSLSALRKMICVANRVHRVLSRGNGRLVSPSKTEDFPLDWSPTTTSCAQSITASDGVPRKTSIPAEVTCTRLSPTQSIYRFCPNAEDRQNC